MAKMILGGYTFELNPEISFSVLGKKKYASHVKTFSSVAYFNWGTTYKGQKIEINWDWMEENQYDSLQTLYESDDTVLFDPIGDGSKTFNVKVLNFYGSYWLKITGGMVKDAIRKKIKMELLIISEGV